MTTSGTNLTVSQIEQLWTSNGGPASIAPLFAAIAMQQSSGNPASVNSSDPGPYGSVGLYQINSQYHPALFSQYGASGLQNAVNNTKAAIALYGQSGLQPWSTVDAYDSSGAVVGTTENPIIAAWQKAGGSGPAAASAALTAAGVSGTGASTAPTTAGGTGVALSYNVGLGGTPTASSNLLVSYNNLMAFGSGFSILNPMTDLKAIGVRLVTVAIGLGILIVGVGFLVGPGAMQFVMDSSGLGGLIKKESANAA